MACALVCVALPIQGLNGCRGWLPTKSRTSLNCSAGAAWDWAPHGDYRKLGINCYSSNESLKCCQTMRMLFQPTTNSIFTAASSSKRNLIAQSLSVVKVIPDPQCCQASSSYTYLGSTPTSKRKLDQQLGVAYDLSNTMGHSVGLRAMS